MSKKVELFNSIKTTLLNKYRKIDVCDQLDNFRKFGMIHELEKMQSFVDVPDVRTIPNIPWQFILKENVDVVADDIRTIINKAHQEENIKL
jgi:hypothetical protein